MKAPIVLDLGPLWDLIAKMTDPQIQKDLSNITREKGVGALIGQSIEDNFNEEGPGWDPLKKQSIRQSLSKANRKKLTGYNTLKGSDQPARRILDRHGFLKASATHIGAKGNIYQPKKDIITWGTDLVYAGIHNRGGIIGHPGTRNGFGKKIYIPPHNIKIPKREFLVIHTKRLIELRMYVLGLAKKIVVKALKT